MSNPKLLIFAGVICLGACGLVPAYDIPNLDLNNDSRVDFSDFAILAGNWQQSGTNLAGDIDNSGTVDINDLTVFCWYWLTEYSEYQQCQKADLNNDGIIAFEDLAIFAQNWLQAGTGLIGDFDDSNLVDYADLAVMADCWLKGNRPEDIWEQFKAALNAGDTNKALTFVSEISRDKYASIFQIIGPGLPDYAAGMGDLILKSTSEIDGEIKYEMTHQVSSATYLFPVIFIKDEHGNWQIYNF
ncbi:MAG: dockerin type I domain-containing protein [Sedimentisphaerales bacterium]